MTTLVGVAAVGVLPQLKGSPAVAEVAVSVRPASLETAALAQLAIPEPAPKLTPIPTVAAEAPAEAPESPLPAGSGKGYRVVFDQGDQRVWMVNGDGTVERTYLVSGSKFNNLGPGTYAVQSRSRYAGAFDGSGTMEYFVRFATGNSAPIGFHSVPVDSAGVIEQTKAQLGTRLSAGCVRQWMPDAIAMWDFAPVGTTVVVTA